MSIAASIQPQTGQVYQFTKGLAHSKSGAGKGPILNSQRVLADSGAW